MVPALERPIQLVEGRRPAADHFDEAAALVATDRDNGDAAARQGTPEPPHHTLEAGLELYRDVVRA